MLLSPFIGLEGEGCFPSGIENVDGKSGGQCLWGDVQDSVGDDLQSGDGLDVFEGGCCPVEHGWCALIAQSWVYGGALLDEGFLWGAWDECELWFPFDLGDADGSAGVVSVTEGECLVELPADEDGSLGIA